MFALLFSAAGGQDHEILRGDACPDCAPDEVAVKVWGETQDARSVQAFAPCAVPPAEVLDAAARRGDLTDPAFALRVPSDARPAWFRDLLVSLDADLQHPLARLLNGFTSECLILGVRVEDGKAFRGYRLAAASPRAPERPCRTSDGDCPFHANGFSTLPTEMRLADARWVVAVYRNYGNPDDLDGADRTAFLTVYLGPAAP